MEAEIELSGQEADERALLDLQDWLARERVAGLRVERVQAPGREGEMGFELMTVLSLIFGSAATAELARSLHTWLESRRSKLRLRIKIGDNEIEIDGDGPLPDQQTLFQNLSALIERLDSTGKSDAVH